MITKNKRRLTASIENSQFSNHNSQEASRGFEPLNKGFADPCLTTWPRRHFKELSGRWDSNPRSFPWQGNAVPLSYARVLTNFFQSQLL